MYIKISLTSFTNNLIINGEFNMVKPKSFAAGLFFITFISFLLLTFNYSPVLAKPLQQGSMLPFPCEGDDAFLVQTQHGELYQIDYSDPINFIIDNIQANSGFEYNNLGFRESDGFMYAVQLNGSGWPGGANGIVRIGLGGETEFLGAPVGLPVGGGIGTPLSDPYPRFDAGDISTDGNWMYITVGNNRLNTPAGYNRLYILDMVKFLADPTDPTALSFIEITAPTHIPPITPGNDYIGRVNDWAYNPINGLLYGGDSTHGRLAVLDPATGFRTEYDIPFLPAGIAFGGAWFNRAGNLFLYRNTVGEIYEIDLGADPNNPTPTIENIQFGPQSQFVDATSCLIVSPPVQDPDTLPSTGFAPGRITHLPLQPADKVYTSSDLILEIPKLDVSAPIMGVPVVSGKWDVAWLGSSVGWLEGTAFPTFDGNTGITAHVWDAYNNPGPFVNLKNLRYGDTIKIHAWGFVFTYAVRYNYVTYPGNMTPLKHEEYDWVTLLTCERYSSTYDEYRFRRVVRAVLVDVSKE